MNEYTLTGPDLFVIGIAILITFGLVWTWIWTAKYEGDEEAPVDPITRLVIGTDCLLCSSTADSAVLAMNSLIEACSLKLGGTVVVLSKSGDLFITGKISHQNGYHITIER